MSFTSFVTRTARKDLRTSITARSISVFGDEVAVVTLTLRVHDSGGGPALVAAVLAAGMLPVALMAAPAGQLVDRLDSRTLLLTVGAAQTALCVALALARGIAATLILLTALGALQAVTQATWQALVPRIVGDENLAAAMGRVQAAQTLAFIAAPALAGVLTGWLGSGSALLLDAATFLAVCAAALTMRTRRRPASNPAQDRARATEGLRFLRRDPVVAPLVACLAVFALLGLMVTVVEVFLVRDTLGASSSWYGALLAAWAGGLVLGALGAGRASSTVLRVRWFVTAAVVLNVALAGFALARTPWQLVPVSVLGGIANGVINVTAGAVVMTRAPEAIRGRVAAALGAVASAAGFVSLLVGGALATVLDPRAVFALSGVLAAISVLATGRRAVRAAMSAPPPTPEPL